jgi:hypothetical protein
VETDAELTQVPQVISTTSQTNPSLTRWGFCFVPRCPRCPSRAQVIRLPRSRNPPVSLCTVIAGNRVPVPRPATASLSVDSRTV